MTRAVFLDRDGVLNRERGFVTGPDELEVFEAAGALAELGELGYRRIVVTNQSGIARGLYTWRDLNRIHAKLRHGLGNQLDAIFVCPHHPAAGAGRQTRACPCRKPASGLLERAQREYGIDLAASWLIGDAPRDIAAAHAVGVRTILVLGPNVPATADYPEDAPAPDEVVSDVVAAARVIAGAPSTSPAGARSPSNASNA